MAALILSLLALQACALPHDQAPNALSSSSESTATSSASPSPAKYQNNPLGGVGTSPTDPPPVYAPLDAFDGDSLQLANMQEFIELDLFHYGLARFSDEEFDAAGVDASQRYLIQVWAEQEVGHSTALNNMLGDYGQVQACNYTYPFNTVREFLDFSQVLTRWGEAGVYGFLPHLTSRPAAQILLQSITTEAKQEQGLAQMEGLFPTPYWFNMGLPQAYAWTLLSRYITSCPPSNPRINFNVFPLLNVTNERNFAAENLTSHVSNNLTSTFSPGSTVQLSWESPGKQVGPSEQGGYFSAIPPSVGPPKFL